ncbi:hypothetical protein Vretifemale_10745, partial [Volvox reticuliferus]
SASCRDCASAASNAPQQQPRLLLPPQPPHIMPQRRPKAAYFTPVFTTTDCMGAEQGCPAGATLETGPSLSRTNSGCVNSGGYGWVAAEACGGTTDNDYSAQQLSSWPSSVPPRVEDASPAYLIMQGANGISVVQPKVVHTNNGDELCHRERGCKAKVTGRMTQALARLLTFGRHVSRASQQNKQC